MFMVFAHKRRLEPLYEDLTVCGLVTRLLTDSYIDLIISLINVDVLFSRQVTYE